MVVALDGWLYFDSSSVYSVRSNMEGGMLIVLGLIEENILP